MAPGSPDSTWVSFRSVNSPTRYPCVVKGEVCIQRARDQGATSEAIFSLVPVANPGEQGQ